MESGGTFDKGINRDADIMSDEKKKKEFGSIDLMRAVGMAPRKKKPEDAKYGRFNRRMMAATVDSLVLFLALPILDPIFTYFYGPVPVNFEQLRAEVQQQATPEMASQLYMSTLYHSGFYRYWLYNTTYQFAFLASFACICWFFWSTTPGKMLFRLKIVDVRTEQNMSFLQCILRAMSYFVSGAFFGLGFIWIIFDKRRQGWHDKIADTVVVTIPWAPFKRGKNAHESNEVIPTSEAADR
jgi:uncharacterized RDD family membrane protein YckC